MVADANADADADAGAKTQTQTQARSTSAVLLLLFRQVELVRPLRHELDGPTLLQEAGHVVRLAYGAAADAMGMVGEFGRTMPVRGTFNTSRAPQKHITLPPPDTRSARLKHAERTARQPPAWRRAEHTCRVRWGEKDGNRRRSPRSPSRSDLRSVRAASRGVPQERGTAWPDQPARKIPQSKRVASPPMPPTHLCRAGAHEVPCTLAPHLTSKV